MSSSRVRVNRFFLALAALVVVACRPPAPAVPPSPAPAAVAFTRPATLEELVRVRCRLDGEQVITTWTGAVYAVVPAEAANPK